MLLRRQARVRVLALCREGEVPSVVRKGQWGLDGALQLPTTLPSPFRRDRESPEPNQIASLRMARHTRAYLLSLGFAVADSALPSHLQLHDRSFSNFFLRYFIGPHHFIPSSITSFHRESLESNQSSNLRTAQTHQSLLFLGYQLLEVSCPQLNIVDFLRLFYGTA